MKSVNKSQHVTVITRTQTDYKHVQHVHCAISTKTNVSWEKTHGEKIGPHTTLFSFPHLSATACPQFSFTARCTTHINLRHSQCHKHTRHSSRSPRACHNASTYISSVKHSACSDNLIPCSLNVAQRCVKGKTYKYFSPRAVQAQRHLLSLDGNAQHVGTRTELVKYSTWYLQDCQLHFWH